MTLANRLHAHFLAVTDGRGILPKEERKSRIIMDDLWLCYDCTQVEVAGDSDALYGVTEEEASIRLDAIEKGRTALALIGHLAPDWDSNTGEGIQVFSKAPCDCCSSHLAGERHRFVVLA